MDEAFAEICVQYKVFMAHVVPQNWRLILAHRHLASKVDVTFILWYIFQLYSHKVYRGKIINMTNQNSMILASNYSDNYDQIWFKKYLVVQTKFIFSNEKIQFLEKWNHNRECFAILPLFILRITLTIFLACSCCDGYRGSTQYWGINGWGFTSFHQLLDNLKGHYSQSGVLSTELSW